MEFEQLKPGKLEVRKGACPRRCFEPWQFQISNFAGQAPFLTLRIRSLSALNSLVDHEDI